MKYLRKTLSLILICLLTFGTVAIGGDGFIGVLKASAYSTGDLIEFGSYPQTDVTDSMGSILNNITDKWISYNYYLGTGKNDGQMKPSDYVQYKDVVYNGNKYRGVRFDLYRPSTTSDPSPSPSHAHQYENGYYTGTTYWFKYEPIKWQVLGIEDDGIIVISEKIIDSQAFNNYVLVSDTNEYEFWGNPSKTSYANNYSQSSIREWLTNSFYSTAFSYSQQSKILTRECDNSFYYTDYKEYNSNPLKTNDRVFLLSHDEAINTKYGFINDQDEIDTARVSQGTDYAKCQGLLVIYDNDDYNGNSFWWLRNPDFCLAGTVF